MYLELRTVADYGNAASFIDKLNKQIGVNAVDPAVAVAQTSFQPNAADVIPKVIAAEQIQHKTYILYFFEGNDTIVAHITGQSLAVTKGQAIRITRGLPKLFDSPDVEMKSSAVIYAEDSRTLDIPVISGEKTTFRTRLLDAFTERWMTRVVAPAIVFWIAAAFLPGTTFFQSALVGLLAVLLSVSIEGVVWARKADDWKWKEVNS